MSTVRFLADHDLNEQNVEGVRRREPAIEFLRVRDVGLQTRPDIEVLSYAHREQLLLVSHDVNTMTTAAASRLDESLGLSGSLLVPQSEAVGSVIESLLLIWSATAAEDWENPITFLPL